MQQVFCIRSLPANEGEILVNEFRDFDINAVLIEDNEYQSLKGNIDMIIVGCDLLSKNYFINKKGTQNLLHRAKKHNIQTWIVGDFLRFITKYNEPTKENKMKILLLILMIGSLFADETKTAGVINITKKCKVEVYTA